MSTKQEGTNSLFFLLKKDFESVKKQAHFEWVAEYEKTIKELATEVFNNSGVDEKTTLNIALNRLGEFLETMKNNLDGLNNLVSEKTDVNESAKTFVVQWIESAKPHYSLDYYHKGDGPTMEKIRSALDSPIEFNLKLATHLANLDDGVEFKKAVSEFAKNVIVQSNIDVLNKVKKDLESIKKSSP